MHASVGDIVYYLPEKTLSGGEVSDAFWKAPRGRPSQPNSESCGTLHPPVTLVGRAEIDEEGLSVLRSKNAELMTERQALVHQLDALKAAILSWQKEADSIDGQLQLWKEAAKQAQQSLTEYKETSKNLSLQVDSHSDNGIRGELQSRTKLDGGIAGAGQSYQ